MLGCYSHGDDAGGERVPPCITLSYEYWLNLSVFLWNEKCYLSRSISVIIEEHILRQNIGSRFLIVHFRLQKIHQRYTVPIVLMHTEGSFGCVPMLIIVSFVNLNHLHPRLHSGRFVNGYYRRDLLFDEQLHAFSSMMIKDYSVIN